MVTAIDLALLLLEFDALPCFFRLALTKKPDIDAVVKVQKSIQLIQNCTFLYNNKTIYLKVLKNF